MYGYGYYGYGPWFGPGWGRGRGRGFGRGRGWGAMLGYCPWTGMPRGWRWFGWYSPYWYNYGPWQPPVYDDKEQLRREKEALEAELRELKKRLEELRG